MQNEDDHQNRGDSSLSQLSTEADRKLLTAADQAMAVHDWETAIDLLSQLLAGTPGETESDIKTKYALLVKRAACYQKLGHVGAELADREAIYALVQHINDVALQVRSLIDLGYPYTQNGAMDKALAVEEQALAIAQDIRDRKLEADSLSALCDVNGRVNHLKESFESGQRAIDIFQSLDDAAGEARTLWQMSYFNLIEGNTSLARNQAERALKLCKLIGDLEGQGNALNLLAIANPDQAKRRRYYEQAMGLFFETGNVERQNTIEFNLGSVYGALGLYQRSTQIYKKTRDSALRYHNKLFLTYALVNLSEQIDLLNIDRLAQNKIEIKIGIGIASGQVIAGYTGTMRRATYTCVGDTVNLAARLESHTKVVGKPILIDETTHTALISPIQTNPEGSFQLKGKLKEVQVYSVDPGQKV